MEMEFIEDFFECDACQGTEFKRVYNFGIRFHKVNFSDNLIYDRVGVEKYECVRCGRIFTIEEIESAMADLRRQRKQS